MKTYFPEGLRPFSVSASERIRLTNSGGLEIHCLGTGSMVSSGHGNTSYFVVKGETHLLIDCGPSIPLSLEKFGVDPSDVNCVYLTHSHADHIAGFPKLAVHARYFPGTKPKRKLSLLGDPEWLALLWDTSLRGDLGTHDKKDPRQAAHDLWYDIIVPDSVPDARTQVFRFGDLKIESFRVAHTPAYSHGWEDSAWATGLLIDDKIWISGDTRSDPELVDRYAGKASVLFHDVASGKSPVHASFDELSALPSEVKSRMWLIHYGDEWVSDSLPSAGASQLVESRGFLGLAYTGLRVSVP
ncbi:MAG TPA: MBL fold metallo-hydrolase [Candidatus Paceibacterota bacterium]